MSATPLETVANDGPALSGGPTKVLLWSFSIIRHGLINVVDIRNGLCVLRDTGPAPRRSSGSGSWRRLRPE